MKEILSYFNEFTPKQLQQFEELINVYRFWNEKINVISRKDIEEIYTKHVLHSLSIAAICSFTHTQKIIDLGTGGGFPGIPLAIFFPDTEFILIDSIQKKINVVNEVINALHIKNATTKCIRIENLKEKNTADFVVSRAVAPLIQLWRWSKPLLRPGNHATLSNSLLCLKGGDLNQEISESNTRPTLYPISEIFRTPFFSEKFIVQIKR